MEIRQLKYFIVVAEEGNISRAAARLHISQPPLTRHIQSLEEGLGVKLFHRTTSGVELTQAGVLLLQHARDIKAHVELASLQARRMAAGQVGRIEVGVYGTAMLDIVPRILKAFSDTHPDVELAMQSAPKGPQLEALRQGRLQILFDRNLVETDDIAVELIAREPIMLALHKDHPLAAQDEIAIPQLDGLPMVGELGRVHQRSSHMFQRHRIVHNVVHYAGDMISASILAASGFGIAFVPASMARMQLPELVYRPIAGEPDAHMQLHVGYRRNETNPLLAEMLEIARTFSDTGGAGAAPAS